MVSVNVDVDESSTQQNGLYILGRRRRARDAFIEHMVCREHGWGTEIE